MPFLGLMEKLTFNKSPAPTIGVELEIQILDSEKYELTPLAPDILKMVPDSLSERIKPEFIKSMVEINTGICSTVSNVERDLTDSFNYLNNLTEGLGAKLYSSGLHPFSRGADQMVSDKPSYRKIMDELQLAGRRFIGMRPHKGLLK